MLSIMTRCEKKINKYKKIGPKTQTVQQWMDRGLEIRNNDFK